MTSYLTEIEAAQLIEQHPEQYATSAALRQLVDRVSMEASGATTVLYGRPLVALGDTTTWRQVA
jgi:hypothetical protein